MQILDSITKWIVTLAPPLLLTLHFMVIAGGLYGVFYVWKKGKLFYLKIQQRFPNKKDVAREIRYSIYTSLIFSIVIVAVMWLSANDYTLIYRPIDKYGYGYFVFSVLLMIVIHDAYFYWTHRLLHWKPLYKHVHVVHHRSLNPTPFSAYAFHPVEALVEVGIVPVIVFTVPYHYMALTIFSGYALIMNIMGHMGYEFFPKSFAHNKAANWHNSATHHNMHHKYVKYNFGLYFNLWDKWMKTNHPKYEEHFEKVVNQRDAAKVEPQDNIVASENAPVIPAAVAARVKIMNDQKTAV
ncbi:sterol desaturase family protein [Mucilaginibacter auburnensis]|uniref:Sterol desaturase/sphingolipid hydroxylase (Fatty acid hydroxylase superfamily) n=1 Tax=Mucilaginibacter auburnensis TaxID=1457233 RepID=A0A2H9VS30_9SPHI|nr:sterol desaturase family protein [Mucilaginibacter auburnensis]PJJ83621.1 sterol desaturase/sphingolipid hydroxylase (fatty acid hydroxylase superfamily) [Mucilaginibacter auburnensis]